MAQFDKNYCYVPVGGLAQEPFTAKGQRGLTIHYTASGNLTSTINEMTLSHLGYHFLIDRNGAVSQHIPLTHRANHAGKAHWNGLSPNKSHLAIAMVSWGLLTKDGYAYTGKKVESVSRGGQLWHPATIEQEKSLIELCKKLLDHFKISHIDVCGHDECALPEGRKSDPGRIMSITMGDLRQILGSYKLIS